MVQDQRCVSLTSSCHLLLTLYQIPQTLYDGRTSFDGNRKNRRQLSASDFDAGDLVLIEGAISRYVTQDDDEDQTQGTPKRRRAWENWRVDLQWETVTLLHKGHGRSSLDREDEDVQI